MRHARTAALVMIMLASACDSDYWVRPDAAAGTGWVAARRVRDDTPVALRDADLRTWRVRRDGVRRVSGRFRSPVAFAAGVLLTVLGGGLATVAVAFAEDSHDTLGVDTALALAIGIPGAVVSLVGGGLLWLGWPIGMRGEPLSAHPGVGEPPPPSPPSPDRPRL